MIRNRKTVTTRAMNVSLAKPKIDVSSTGASGVGEERIEEDGEEAEVEEG